MKKIILTTLVIALPVALIMFSMTSCKKCYICRVSITYSSNSPYVPNTPASTSSQVCDKTQKEIEDYEKAGTSTTTATYGGVTVTEYTTTTCN